MTIEWKRKRPIGIISAERLKITLDGTHSIKQKIAMLLQVKFELHHEHGIDFAGPSDVWLSLVDQNGYPLTHFADGRLIADYNPTITHPYHCAADHYRIG